MAREELDGIGDYTSSMAAFVGARTELRVSLSSPIQAGAPNPVRSPEWNDRLEDAIVRNDEVVGSIPSRSNDLQTPSDIEQQLETAKTTYRRFGQYSRRAGSDPVVTGTPRH